MTSLAEIIVRDATQADREFILGLVPRLRAFGDPPLRPADTIDAAERRALERALDDPPPASMLVVAEDAGATPIGIAYAETGSDYFTGEQHAHLAILAVAEGGEGRGVGRALLQAVEHWAAERSYRFVTLNVFAANTRARGVYERAGYEPDTIRYVRELPRRAP